MSDNRFSSFNRTDEVLAQFAVWWCYGNRESIIPDALARIAELTPRTVTAEQRTRAISAAIDYRSRPADVLVDRIIDALGWKAEPAPQTADKYGRAACVCGYVPPTHTHADDCPVFSTQARAQAPIPAPATSAVELTAPELESLAGIVREHERTAIDVGPLSFSLRSVPMVVEDMPERDGAKLDGVSVLRIGGGDE